MLGLREYEETQQRYLRLERDDSELKSKVDAVGLFDCQEMFKHACAFAECADFAMREFNRKTADIERYDMPSIINLAFACEVFLKSMLDYYGIDYKKVHELKKLFELLPEIIRVGIKFHIMENYAGKWRDACDREYLENISDAFVKWRYIYEYRKQRGSNTIYISFLEAFRNVLRDKSCRLFFDKSWDEYCK